MSTSDALTLVQILLALLTSLLLIWYIVVTHKLQRQAQEQSHLQMEQLKVAKQELSQALFRERSLLVPYIRWRDGASSPTEEKWEFENVGADIRNVRWSVASNLTVQYQPRHMIRTFDKGSIQLQTSQPPLRYPVRFTLGFTNRFGEVSSQDFELTGPGTEPKEVLPYQG